MSLPANQSRMKDKKKEMTPKSQWTFRVTPSISIAFVRKLFSKRNLDSTYVNGVVRGVCNLEALVVSAGKIIS